MNKKHIKTSFPNRSKERKFYKSSFLRIVLNHIGRRKNFIDCFCCGDSLWWKEDISMAFTKDRPDELPFGKYPSELEDKLLEQKPGEAIFLGRRSGVSICQQGFINKSEEELVQIFETVIKPFWMKGKNLDQIEKIRNYDLYLPIRTTGGTFKKEMVESEEESNHSFSTRKFLRKLHSLFTRGSPRTSVR